MAQYYSYFLGNSQSWNVSNENILNFEYKNENILNFVYAGLFLYFCGSNLSYKI